MRNLSTPLTILCLFALLSTSAAQQPPKYGEPISLDDAKKVMAAAEKEAAKEDWPVSIAIVDSTGYLVMFQRLENSHLGSVEIALEKAKGVALFRRPTKVFQDTIEGGGAGLRMLRFPAIPLEGGVPIIVEGKLIGAVGVSGVKSNQDAQVAEAGIKALVED
ncbi:MAG: heme-binding protein [Pirellulaceae bacterium]